MAAGQRPVPEEAPEGAPGQHQEEEPGEALRDGALGGTRQPTRPADETCIQTPGIGAASSVTAQYCAA